eukprot:530273_1
MNIRKVDNTQQYDNYDEEKDEEEEKLQFAPDKLMKRQLSDVVTEPTAANDPSCPEQKKQSDPYKIPYLKSRNNSDPYPSYIYKSIWQKSDDHNLEVLMDEIVKKISKSSRWKNKKWINALYNDGLNDMTELNLAPGKTYLNFVEKIYTVIGGKTFFDEFIEKRYKREIEK